MEKLDASFLDKGETYKSIPSGPVKIDVTVAKKTQKCFPTGRLQ